MVWSFWEICVTTDKQSKHRDCDSPQSHDQYLTYAHNSGLQNADQLLKKQHAYNLRQFSATNTEMQTMLSANLIQATKTATAS